jgi:hypothetical protein
MVSLNRVTNRHRHLAPDRSRHGSSPDHAARQPPTHLVTVGTTPRTTVKSQFPTAASEADFRTAAWALPPFSRSLFDSVTAPSQLEEGGRASGSPLTVAGAAADFSPGIMIQPGRTALPYLPGRVCHCTEWPGTAQTGVNCRPGPQGRQHHQRYVYTAAVMLLAAADSEANASMKVMGQIDLDAGRTSVAEHSHDAPPEPSSSIRPGQ